ncbi:hypothetical protein ACI7YW_09910 [Clostridium ljungdahlii]|uniref:hypothetical protein n=1 Tax=Clostridium ljungdahlii TaxID=1538 RepID=UPI00386969E9
MGRQISLAIREYSEENKISISQLCEIVGVARCSYYKWLKRIESMSDKENATIIKIMIEIYSEVQGIYGYRRSFEYK